MCPGADQEPNGHANGANGAGATGVNQDINGGMHRLPSSGDVVFELTDASKKI